MCEFGADVIFLHIESRRGYITQGSRKRCCHESATNCSHGCIYLYIELLCMCAAHGSATHEHNIQ